MKQKKETGLCAALDELISEAPLDFIGISTSKKEVVLAEKYFSSCVEDFKKKLREIEKENADLKSALSLYKK